MRHIPEFGDFIQINESLRNARDKFLNPGRIDAGSFDRLVDIDPTRNHKGLPKMIEFYLDDPDRLTDIVNALKDFERLADNLEKKDINQYSNIDELITAIERASNTKSQFKKNAKDKKIYEDGNYEIFEPTTHEESCEMAHGADWCTARARRRGPWREHINQIGKLYYIRNKKMQIGMPMSMVAILVYYSNTKEKGASQRPWEAYDYQNRVSFKGHATQEYNPNIKPYVEKVLSEIPVEVRNKITTRVEQDYAAIADDIMGKQSYSEFDRQFIQQYGTKEQFDRIKASMPKRNTAVE